LSLKFTDLTVPSTNTDDSLTEPESDIDQGALSTADKVRCHLLLIFTVVELFSERYDQMTNRVVLFCVNLVDISYMLLCCMYQYLVNAVP
jgi:hypothetical protein